jgi:hypothetical protein
MLRILDKKCTSDRTGKFTASQEAENSNRDLLQEQCKQGSN